MEDYNSYLIDVKKNLERAPLDKYWLINEAFILWYTLVEGVACDDFSEDDRLRMLQDNFGLYKREYREDKDYSFIIGWMTGISPWFFGQSVDDEYGKHLLVKAYKSSAKNALFKWAIRDEIGLTNKEIEYLKIDILSRFNFFFNYGELIEEYFQDIIKGSS